MQEVSYGFRLKPVVAAVALICAGTPAWADGGENTLADTVVLGTAEEALKQAPGVSIITAEDIAKRPPANDLSEIIRTMPGVNLTGNSTSGQRGNNRQIDLRGMGPENTLILIDGKPASSRNSVRYGWRGERDTRGDSNWVPAEQVERIEVIRGPAAARYGNGAAGGVVNIITKSAAKETHGQVTLYTNLPEHSKEGDTQRMNFGLSGPLSEQFSYRLFGNIAKTDADDPLINLGHAAPGFTGIPAGREGVRNKDFGGRLSWLPVAGQQIDFDYAYSQQSNIYAGDNQNVNNVNSALVSSMYDKETNRMTRKTYGLTHKGKFDFGNSLSYIQYAQTENMRVQEGLVGGTEGVFSGSSPSFVSNTLKETTAHSEVNIPLRGGLNQMLTLGVEWVDQKLNDPTSNTVGTSYGTIPGVSASGRNADSSARIFSVFAEDNIELTSTTILTPGLRFDNHSLVGTNWSPSLNLTQMLGEAWSVKAGIARAYKAPNLYQTNPGYLMYSSNNGCYAVANGTTGCYLMGNADLEAETSINKELGVEFKQSWLAAGLTWFHNDYRDKIQPGITPVAITTTGNRSIYQWTNIPEAVVEGLEGNVRIPLLSSLQWNTNFTYMLESKNKTTGDYLSITPKYTVNSSLDWQASDVWNVLAAVTWYGAQEPMKYDYKGNPVSGSSANAIAPYAIFNLSTGYQLFKNLKVSAGINNVFDKRQFRAGNSVSVGTSTALGAGAYTYNEPGRTYFLSLTSSF